MRSRQKGTKTFDQADGSTTVDAGNFGFHHSILLLKLQNLVPSGAVLDSANTNQKLTVFVFIRNDLEVHFFVQIDQGIEFGTRWLDESGLAFRQESRCLGTNINNHASVGIFDTGSLNNRMALETVGSLCDSIREIIVREAQGVGGDVGSGSLVQLLQTIKSRGSANRNDFFIIGAGNGGGLQGCSSDTDACSCARALNVEAICSSKESSKSGCCGELHFTTITTKFAHTMEQQVR
mmetsp:Transcript_134309/g.199890  ORF Transcript_134309/g.199890 Transcript_134309/m.199890 type:complete len:236 (+) Transcript_134309:652-1359(+)